MVLPMAGCSPLSSGAVTESCARHWKRKKEVTPETSSESPLESEGEVNMDPESYYQSTPKEMEKVVDAYMEKTFRRYIPKHKRNEMAKDYPKPSSQAVSVSKLDHDIKGALGKKVSDKSDAQLAKIQASILATSASLANYWSHLKELDLSGTVRCQQERLLQLANIPSLW